MPKIILILALLIGICYWWSYLKKLPKDKSRPFLWRTGFWLVLGIAAYLVLTGKMHWLGAGLAALVPLLRSVILWGFRAAPLVRLLGRFKSTPSQFRTASLVVTINFASGQITGEITTGDLAGKQLSELSTDEIEKLSQQLKQTDKESYVLLQAYLMRSGSTNEQSANDFTSDSYKNISKAEAYEVLGISDDSSQQEVIKAHKRLIQKLHPDRGGSDYLAAKINAAKDLLIK
jgi:hypothetical protein